MAQEEISSRCYRQVFFLGTCLVLQEMYENVHMPRNASILASRTRTIRVLYLSNPLSILF